MFSKIEGEHVIRTLQFCFDTLPKSHMLFCHKGAEIALDTNHKQ